MENNINILNATASAINNALEGHRGQMGFTLVTETPCRMRKTNNPLVGQVTKVTTYKNARFGVDYENAVNGKLERAGLTPDFVADKSVTKYLNEFLNIKDNQIYLKVGINSQTKRATTYLVNGNIATDEQMQIIRQFEQVSKPSAKQQSHGLQADEVYYHITIKVENVLSINKGDEELYKRETTHATPNSATA